MPMNLDI